MCLDDYPLSGFCGIHDEMFEFREKQNNLKKLIHILSLFCTDFNRRNLPAIRLHEHLFFCKLLLNLIRI